MTEKKKRDLPLWLEEELAAPAEEGDRNAQLIRIGPSLIRHGYTPDELLDIFHTMQPEIHEDEIDTLVRQAVKYADNDRDLNKGEWVQRRRKLAQLEMQFRDLLPEVLADYAWPLSELTQTRPSDWDDRAQRFNFLLRMFDPLDVVWIGAVHQSGQEKNAKRFRTVQSYLSDTKPIRGEFVTHCTFQPGTFSRCNDAVAVRRYMVVESDTLQANQVGAVLNYLAAEQGLILRAVVHSGGKSVHGWFEWPSNATEDEVEEWGATLTGLSCDPATLKASQPVRLPGCVRGDSGRRQLLLYLA